MLDRKNYKLYVEQTAPKSPMVRSLITAFIIGGLICVIGEGVQDITKIIAPNLEPKQLGAWESVVMITLGGLLTAFGLYDKLGHYAGGGSIIPITGFANSIVSPAMEYNREGIFYGICAKMFVIAGPVIVFGVTASFIVGVVGLIVG